MKKGRIAYVTLGEEGHHIVKYYSYSDKFLLSFLGGRGFNIRFLTWTSSILPLRYSDPSNMICISPGLLSGTVFPSSGRTSIGVLKSPITGFWGEGNFGGYFGPAMKLCGIDSLIIDGTSDIPVALHILEGGAITFIDCSDIWKCGTLTTAAILEKRNNPLQVKRRVLCIGQAGTNEIFSSIALCDNRTSGGAGAGAVLGSKMIKAIVVDQPEYRIECRDEEGMEHLRDMVEERIKNHPVFDTFSTYGTTSLVEIHSGLKYLPTKNWMAGTWNKWKKISGKTLLKVFKKDDPNFQEKEEQAKEREDLGCINCPITCSNMDKIEYETLNCLGAKLGIDDINWIRTTNLNYFNDGGLDVIQTTSIISALMEMNERGVLTSELKWGNKVAVEQFLNWWIEGTLDVQSELEFLSGLFKHGFRSGIEKSLSNQFINLSKLPLIDVMEKTKPKPVYPKDIVDYIVDEFYPNVKGMSLSGVFPSDKNRGCALAVATSSRGADHLRSLPTLATYADWYLGKGAVKKLVDIIKMPLRSLFMMKADTKNLVGDLYQTYIEVFGVPHAIVERWKKLDFLLDPEKIHGWGSMIKFCQEVYAVSDSLGTCRFISPWRFGIGPYFMVDAIKNLTGLYINWSDLLRVGERIYALEKYFATKYRIHIKDSLPKRFLGNKNGKLGKGTFDAMKTDYYIECGYDIVTGIPTKELMFEVERDTITDQDLYMLENITDRRREIFG